MDGTSLAGIFNSDEFTMRTLTASINEKPYIPSRLADLKIFDEGGVPTTTIQIEKQGTTLSIVPSKPRGAPGTAMTADKRTASVPINVPHFPVYDELLADELINVRSFGTPNQLRTIIEMRDQKLLKMSRSLDLTVEYQRVGAIQGIVYDSDGSTVLLDSFATFGISKPSDVVIDCATAYNASTKQGRIRGLLTAAKRLVRNALVGDAPTPAGNEPTGYWVACSEDFFDALINNGEVRDTYLAQVEAKDLRNNEMVGEGGDRLTYAGMVFEAYRGTGSVAIPAGKAQIVPIGVPQMFITRYAPAPWFEAVNTIGLPRYSMATLDPTGQKKIDMEAQTNSISLCTRPAALQRLSLT